MIHFFRLVEGEGETIIRHVSMHDDFKRAALDMGVRYYVENTLAICHSFRYRLGKDRWAAIQRLIQHDRTQQLIPSKLIESMPLVNFPKIGDDPHWAKFRPPPEKSRKDGSVKQHVMVEGDYTERAESVQVNEAELSSKRLRKVVVLVNMNDQLYLTEMFEVDLRASGITDGILNSHLLVFIRIQKQRAYSNKHVLKKAKAFAEQTNQKIVEINLPWGFDQREKASEILSRLSSK